MKQLITMLMLAQLLSGSAYGAPYPAHDKAELRCLDCHVGIPLPESPLALHNDLSSICSGCHRHSHYQSAQQASSGHHPIGVKPAMPVPLDMVLDKDGAMTCATCHLYHEAGRGHEDMPIAYLRRPSGKSLCLTCHKKI